MGKKILITATELHMDQFWTQHIKNLIDRGNDVDLVCSHVGDRLDALKSKLSDIGNPRLTIVDLKRSPVSPHNIHGYFQLRKYFSENLYDIVITNEPVMGLMTRLAARTTRRKNGTKVIYFAHGFHFWQGAQRLNWMLFYPIEKIGGHFTDILVTMNSEDFELAKKHIKAGECRYTYGIGVDLSNFHKKEGVRERKRRELGLDDSTFMLYSTSELNDRKNLRSAAEIVAELKNRGYNVHFFDRGVGDQKEMLESYAKELGIEDSFTLLGYGKDVDEMCLAADAFLFTSKQEGLPVAVMEAMSCGLPCVASDIRGVSDLIENGSGGFVCSLGDVNEFCERIIYLIRHNDEASREELTRNNIKKLEPYSFENVNSFICNLVESI